MVSQLVTERWRKKAKSPEGSKTTLAPDCIPLVDDMQFPFARYTSIAILRGDECHHLHETDQSRFLFRRHARFMDFIQSTLIGDKPQGLSRYSIEK